MSNERLSMETSLLQTREKARRHVAAMSPPEQLVYSQQISLCREGAKLSGIPEWTHEHTVGALFSTQAIRIAVHTAHQAGVFTHRLYEALNVLLDSQERVSVLMEENPGGGPDGG